MKHLRCVMTISLILCLLLCSCKVQAPVVVNNKDIEVDDYVRLADGVSLDMNSADYWVKDGYDEQLMSASEIEKFNSDNGNLISTNCAGNFSLQSIKDVISGDIVTELINSLTEPEDRTNIFVNEKQVGDEYWLNLEENINVSAVPDKVTVKFAFSTQRSTLRKFPTADYANEDYDDFYYDLFIMSDYMPFMPVAILHESKDSNWYFIATYGYCGWIQKKYVAVCPSREDWLERQNVEDYLIVTGKEIRLSEDPYCPELSSLVIPMGTKLTVVKSEDAPEEINRRASYGCYIAKLPVRLSDGSISDEYSLIPITSDVSIGYLPFTRENILKQAFKLLGDIYGWAGDFYSNDCSGIVREIYLCFGLEFPRVGNQQINVLGPELKNVSSDSDRDKLDYIKTIDAGSLFYFKGHIMLYLGTVDDEPYVISSVGSIATSDMEEGESMRVNSVIVSSLLRTTRKTGATWLKSITDIVAF